MACLVSTTTSWPAFPSSPCPRQNLDRLLRTHATDHFRKLEALLAALPPRCLLFAGYCSRSLARAEAKREGGPTSFSRLFLGGGEGKLRGVARSPSLLCNHTPAVWHVKSSPCSKRCHRGLP